MTSSPCAFCCSLASPATLGYTCTKAFLCGESPMLCSETDSHIPDVKIGLPIDLAKDISYWLEGIKLLGGNGDLTLRVRGNNVEDIETVVKQSRKRKKIA